MKTRQAVLQGEDFKALWERIKYKTTYRVQFDNEALLAACIQAIKAPNFAITKTRLQWRKADLAIGALRCGRNGNSHLCPRHS